MTSDSVDEVIQAYLDHLEEGAPEPSLDHLTPDERDLAQDLIDSLKAGRGIDPYRSRPSLHSLLAETGLASLLEDEVDTGLTLDAIRADVISALGAASVPVVDSAAEDEGVRSNALSRYGSLRIRFQYRDDITSAAELALVDPREAVGAVHGRFPETAATVLVIGDPEFSSLAIDQYDIEEFIGSPDGQLHPPRITRPVLPLFDTLRRLVDELAPNLAVDETVGDQEPIELADIIETTCRDVCETIVAEGNRSRTEAKKVEWTGFEGDAFLTDMAAAAAANGLTEAQLRDRITAAVAA